MGENNGAPEKTNKKLTTCKACGATVAKKAKKCPNCGAKVSSGGCLTSIIKVAFVFAAILLIGSFLFGGDGSETADNVVSADTPAQTQPEPDPVIEYTAVTVGELEDALKANAFSAKEAYDENYLELTGVVSVIDSNGEYFSMKRNTELFSMPTIICYLGDNMESELAGLAVDQMVTIRGKVFEVGEVLGYYFDIIEFVK